MPHMSILSMTAVRSLRRREEKAEEPQFGPTMQGDEGEGEGGEQPQPLPKTDVLAQLLRYTPTEIVVLYITIVGFLPQIPPADVQGNLWNFDFRPRWVVFFICLALVPLAVAAVQAVRDRAAKKSFQWPWLEFGLAAVAFVAWAIALPLAPLFSWHAWRGWVGSVIAAVVLVVIGLIGKIVGRPLTYD
jgi:hypothetical protein